MSSGIADFGVQFGYFKSGFLVNLEIFNPFRMRNNRISVFPKTIQRLSFSEMLSRQSRNCRMKVARPQCHKVFLKEWTKQSIRDELHQRTVQLLVVDALSQESLVSIPE